MTPIDSAVSLYREIQVQVIRKYGQDAKETSLLSSCILDFNRRMLLWLRNEPGFDITPRFGFFSRIISAIRALESLITGFFVRRCDYVFFPTNETHLVQHIPVALELRSKGVKILMVVSKKRLLKKIPRDLPIFYLSAMYNPFQFRFRQIEVDKLPFDISFVGRTEIRSSILEFMINRVALKSGAKLIVLGNDLSLEGQASCSVFHKLGRKVYTIQHGGVSNPVHSFSKVDCFFAFGERSESDLVANGFPANKIRICGAPFLNNIALKANSPESLLSKLGMGGSPKKICLILLSGPGHSTSLKHNVEIFDALAEASSKIRDVTFLFKLHPKDHEQNYSSWGAIHRIDNGQLQSSGITVFDLIQCADLLVSGASASVLEALYFEKPVLTVDLYAEYESIDFIRAGVTLHRTDRNAVVSTLIHFFEGAIELNDLRQRSHEFISQYYYKTETPPESLIANELIRS